MIIDLQHAMARFQLPVATALHIGAHYGDEDRVYRELGIHPIYVEANPKVFKILTSNLPDRECHQVAIADTVGETEFHVTSFDQSSSILPLKKHASIYPDIVEEQVIRIPCTTIDELLGDRCNGIDMLNLDIQGAELLAFRGARLTLPHVKCVLTEVNRAELYQGCGLIGDLDRFLGQYDLHRVETCFKYHRTWGDALYVKSQYVPAHGWRGKLGGWLAARFRRTG